MSRIESLNRRYQACAQVSRSGVEIVAVGDPSGARLNAAVQSLMVLMKEEGGEYLDDLLGAAKALRWRRMTHPQPREFNGELVHLANEVGRCSRRLAGTIGDEGLLQEITASAVEIAESDSALGDVLERSLREVGAVDCLVIAASKSAAVGMEAWLHELEVLVLTVGELERDQAVRAQAYVVGPPRFFRSSLVTAPVTYSVSYLLPSWFRDRSLPRSAISPYAEGAVRTHTRIFLEGDTAEPQFDVADAVEDTAEFLPQPIWEARKPGAREPGTDEVEAHKILLSGGFAIWLDDGERIRSLDPTQPKGERVTYTDVSAVHPGTYLLLRQGETERTALYKAAIGRLVSGDAVDKSQIAWKHRLAERMRTIGYRAIVRELKAAGVTRADRARAWTDPMLIRPNNDQDFEQLLEYLEIPIQPAFGHATNLRQSLYRVSAEVRERLEEAISTVDLSALEAGGQLSLDLRTHGFRGILATRVLAISPFTTIVSRHDARLPFKDRGGQWLE